MIRPLIGLKLDGPTLAAVDERGGIGTPVWGPQRLLRDLELRIGLPSREASTAVRLAAWRSQLEDDIRASAEPFYARSYAVDPLGTAEMLLTWRDALVEAGWDGQVLAAGGSRLETFTRLERRGAPMPHGLADRLAGVEAALALTQDSPYESITITDEMPSWPGRWRRVLTALQRAGSELRRVAEPIGLAPPDSDLGRLQAHLVATDVTGHFPVKGDGSLLLLEAPTTHEAAETTAAFARHTAAGSYAILRGGERAVLDDALVRQGIAPLGSRAKSPSRAPIQLLPIFVDLIFDPLDPRRLLELFDLRVGPFSSAVRHVMARALCDAPGIGDARWQKAKRRLVELGETDDIVSAWLEQPRFDGQLGAPRTELVSLARRLRQWLRTKLRSREDELVVAAYAQCADFELLLESDPRPLLDRVAVHRLIDLTVGDGIEAAVRGEAAGRPDFIDEPAALLCHRPHIIWWNFVGASARPPHPPRWRRAELDALQAAGVELVDPMTLLEDETRTWRQVALRATESLLLVLPRMNRGERQTHHPFWDELSARLRLDHASAYRLTATSEDVLARRRWRLDVDLLPRLELPPNRATWTVPPGLVAIAGPLAPYAIQELLECPLRAVLGHIDAKRPTTVPSIPEGPHLFGIIGHRLVQYLVETGQLTEDADRTARALEQLLPRVGAPLLQPGTSVERYQLRHQLTTAISALASALRDAKLEIGGVEEEVTASWLDLAVHGRLDLRLTDPASNHAIVDLKWGRRTQREQLEHGRALQLALYAHMVKAQLGLTSMPATAFFSLSRAQMLSADEAFGPLGRVAGPSTADTLARAERSVALVRAGLAGGAIPVTGVASSESLLAALRISERERATLFDTNQGQGCQGCAHAAICGRAWEASW